ncbi:hypothetical protein AK812_SmicGene32970 [Symbiodinium microadriaticum]|uniref:Uncharacterized protein n=1 Tax=Symbiodinium microadriaticum TaxID=2951 RepID=A0A1Q9CST2_SYMMI|nr:hypothetical protein AK812_SmicGene32970 [Symbiodinium microadriaticum]
MLLFIFSQCRIAARFKACDAAVMDDRFNRSRGAELLSNVPIPYKFSDDQVAHKHRARELLDRALQTRRDRKDTEANHQRRQRQRAVLEQLCNKCFSKEMQADPGPGERFWKRHAVSARSRHRVEDGADAVHGVRYSGKHEVRTARLHRDFIDRAPAHTDDSIRAVLRTVAGTGGGNELDTSSTHESKPFIEIEGREGVGVNFDWSEPYVMAYNSASAGIQRQDKWCMQGELSRSMPIPKVRTRPGHDETELKMMHSAAVMESLAGGGVGVATKILGLKERGAPWDHISQFAAMAKATAFEMPKETALEVCRCLAEAAMEAEAEAEVEAIASLRTCAMSLLASAAARARDADSLDFPLCGLEMIAKTGLGWSAFSNMYLDHDLSDSASVPALVAGSWSPSSCSSSAATRRLSSKCRLKQQVGSATFSFGRLSVMETLSANLLRPADVLQGPHIGR